MHTTLKCFTIGPLRALYASFEVATWHSKMHVGLSANAHAGTICMNGEQNSLDLFLMLVQMILNLDMDQAPVMAVTITPLRAALVPAVTHHSLNVSTSDVLTVQQALLQHMLQPGRFKVSLFHLDI